ncbi:hypothetical protein [Xenorhabdus bovienii]|uniref:hypothetical protein n=1 Tax=Xenorhabdus bovienii TaxID=40576 RepID=UPI0030B992FC
MSQNPFDQQGYTLIDIEYEYNVLADFLRGDIQGGLFVVNEFITACNDASFGNSLEWEEIGNAHTVTIKKVVFISSMNI